MQNNTLAIKLSEINFCWGSAKNDFQLEVKKFQLEKSESVILVGPSGGGKSTLLSLICGIVKPRNGIIEILGQNLEEMSNSERDSFRADNIGIIFQQFNLLPYLSALDNVLLPLEFSFPRKKASGEIKEKLNAEAKHLLKSLSIMPETLGKQKAAKLSGINTERLTFLTFANMGMLAAVAGLIFAARLNTATPKAGFAFELDVIAAVFIGGASMSGGVGKVVGAVIGALIMGVMNNGMSLLGIGIDWQQVIKGLVLLAAVIFDVYNKSKRH